MEYKKLKFNFAVVLGGVGYSPLGGLNGDGVYLTVPLSLASGPYFDSLIKNKVIVDLDGNSEVVVPDLGASLLARLTTVEAVANEAKAGLQAATSNFSAAIKVSDLPTVALKSNQALPGSKLLGLAPDKKPTAFDLDSFLQRLLPEGAVTGQIPIRTSTGWGVGSPTGVVTTPPVETPGGGTPTEPASDYALSVAALDFSINNMRTKLAQLQN